MFLRRTREGERREGWGERRGEGGGRGQEKGREGSKAGPPPHTGSGGDGAFLEVNLQPSHSAQPFYFWKCTVRKESWGSAEKKKASLVAQWLSIHLPMQGTLVRALVQEDPTCHGATRPVSHNYY